jgi:hypothetical protein
MEKVCISLVVVTHIIKCIRWIGQGWLQFLCNRVRGNDIHAPFHKLVAKFSKYVHCDFAHRRILDVNMAYIQKPNVHILLHYEHKDL